MTAVIDASDAGRLLMAAKRFADLWVDDPAVRSRREWKELSSVIGELAGKVPWDDTRRAAR